jgi:hypothetical protein
MLLNLFLCKFASMNLKKYIPFLLALVLVLFFVFNTDAQCAMCAATAEKSDYAKSLNTGIGYLLMAPVLILGGVLLLWFFNKDKFRSEQ